MALPAIAIKVGLQVLVQFLQTKAGKATLGIIVALSLFIPVGLLILPSVAVGFIASSLSSGLTALDYDASPNEVVDLYCGISTENPLWIDADAAVEDEESEAFRDALKKHENGDFTFKGIKNTDLVKHEAKYSNAKMIIGIAKSVNFPGMTGVQLEKAREKGAIAAVSTAFIESGLENIDHGDRDSLGLFQQRPSIGWGTREQLTNPQYSATAFYYGVLTNKGRIPGLIDYNITDSAGSLSVEVQRPAAAYESRYFAGIEWSTPIVHALWQEVDPIPVHPDLERDANSAQPRSTSSAGCFGIVPADSDLPVGKPSHPDGWGGHSNGQIPVSALAESKTTPGLSLHATAVVYWDALNVAYKEEFGKYMSGWGYRTYARQVTLKAEKPTLAGTPGTSNHGWATAIDIEYSSYGGNRNSEKHKWLQENAPLYGWVWPEWARTVKPEDWHWEFFNNPSEEIKNMITGEDEGSSTQEPSGKQDAK